MTHRTLNFTTKVIFLMSVLVSSHQGSVYDRLLNDSVLDPCKADSYMGDIALKHDQFRVTTKIIIKDNANESLFGLVNKNSYLQESDIQDSSIHNFETVRRLLHKDLKEKLEHLSEKCNPEELAECRENHLRVHKDIVTIRIKLLRLKKQTRRLQDIVKDGWNGTLCLKSEMTHNVKNMTRNIKSEISLCDPTIVDCNSKYSGHSQSRQERGAINIKEKLWENGVIPYVIEDVFTGKQKALFKLSAEKWEKNTCLLFKEKSPEDRDYIIFTKGECGCCSFVGRQGGGQAISIGQNCDTLGIVTHELGHVIGFHHEHTRPDRDEFVDIIYKNIAEGEAYNFNIQTDIDSLNETYDLDSIMHYSRNKFSVDSDLHTIVGNHLDGPTLASDVGRKVKPSEGDIRQVNKLYHCPACGGTLNEAEDTFGYKPQPGTSNLCQWRISCTNGEIIELTIQLLDLQEESNCDTDYLLIRDGHSARSPFLGRYCSSLVPAVLTSTGIYMWLEFKTSNGNGQGFYASYRTVCGGDIKQDEGYLYSPNYPYEYPPKSECVWTITVDSKYHVGLTFEFFDLEHHDKCWRDYLEIRNGVTENAPLIGKFCGWKKPAPIETEGHQVYLKFVSSSFVQKMGFSIRYTKKVAEG